MSPKSRKPRARANKSPTKAAITKALIDCYGIVGQAAERLGCSRKTIQRAMKKWPELEDARTEGRERIVDLSEHTVVTSIREGDASSARWALGVLGKHRGYGPKSEIEISGKLTVQVDDEDLAAELMSLIGTTGDADT